MSIGLPGGTSSILSRSRSCSRMQPWEIRASAVPISSSLPSGPWMPITASPESSQSPIVSEWAPWKRDPCLLGVCQARRGGPGELSQTVTGPYDDHRPGRGAAGCGAVGEAVQDQWRVRRGTAAVALRLPGRHIVLCCLAGPLISRCLFDRFQRQPLCLCSTMPARLPLPNPPSCRAPTPLPLRGETARKEMGCSSRGPFIGLLSRPFGLTADLCGGRCPGC